MVTRSGTLGYEAASQMKELGIGITTSVGIGGDPINGSSFLDVLKLFEEDPDTHAVMMIGEIGGPQEAEAAQFVKENMTKPVIGYVAGLTAPKGRRMGHAGAIISAFGDTAAEKAEIMRSLGLMVAPSPAELGTTVAKAMAAHSQEDHGEGVSRPVVVVTRKLPAEVEAELQKDFDARLNPDDTPAHAGAAAGCAAELRTRSSRP